MKNSNKIITLSLYNRYDYTFEVLKHLACCKGIEDYRIIPVIDHDNKNGRNQADITQILYTAAKQTRLSIDQPRYHEGNVGCNSNIFTCLNIGFKITDFLIHLEDDIILASDALEYFEWCNKEYHDDPTVFTVDVYNNKEYKTKPSAFEVERSQSFKPWGWATWLDRWIDIKERWQFSYGPRFEGGKQVFNGGGWDVAMKQYLRGNRYRVFPKLPRCKNIGAIGGCHTPSKEWHEEKHVKPVKFWSNDIDISSMAINFQEI